MSQVNANMICMPIGTAVEGTFVSKSASKMLFASYEKYVNRSGLDFESVVVHRLDVLLDKFERGEENGVDNA